MLRKWEWIKEQCLKRNFEKAALLAGEIDAALLEDYASMHTPAWRYFYSDLNTDIGIFHSDFLDVATDPDFCVACSETHVFRRHGNPPCERCRFAVRCGDCSDPDSLYMQFLSEVSKVWPFDEKE